ncbi:T9SS type A sorting domain-containing protein [bacterium]|nr:T9SS type A sorting domain-containing protein [bacterium]
MKKLLLWLCVFIFSAGPANAAWYDYDFKYKQQITILNSQVAGNEMDFPVLITAVDIDPVFFGHVEKATINNMDIIFTNAAQDTELSREIVHFDSGNQELEAWVKTDLSGSVNTVIYMYYGYAAANKPNAADTWSNNFTAVWHLQSATGAANDIQESTANANHGSSQNMDAGNGVIGQISNALNFNGSDEYINAGDDVSLQITGTLTMSAWVNLTDDEANVYNTVIAKKLNWSSTSGYLLQVLPQVNDMEVTGSGGTSAAFDVADYTTNWHFIVGTINATTAGGFFDGGSLGTAATNALATSTQVVNLGRLGNGNESFDGQIDEVRISTVVRSANWISTSFNNQNNPGNFYNVGSEINQPARYRSIGPGNTIALDSGGANALTISEFTASFAGNVSNDIGVGDAIEYDSDDVGTAIDDIAFIYERINANTFLVKRANGDLPVVTTSNQDWNVWRAYRTLGNAESGTENPSIDAVVRFFDDGNRDCVTNDEIWHFACYSGTTADTTGLNWDGWTTDADSYIRIYTPYLSSETGTNQRHNGTWSNSLYRLVATNDDCLQLSDQNVRIEGLQFQMTATSTNDQRAIDITGSVGNAIDIRISYCIFRGYAGTAHDRHAAVGVRSMSIGAGNVYIWNNIVCDFNGDNRSCGFYLEDSDTTMRIYNTTVFNCYNGYRNNTGTFVVKNTIAQGCTNGYEGDFSSAENNVSDLSSDAPGTGSLDNVDAEFVDEIGPDYDLHYAAADGVARFAGVDLSGDANLPISDDIDREARTVSWAVGADENDALPPSPTITPSNTASATITPSPTATPSATVTPTSTESATVTDTPTITLTATITETCTITQTITPTPSITMTPTITPTSTVTPDWTHTATPTVTLTSTNSLTATITPTYTITRTGTATPTVSSTPTITVTLTITVSSTISPTPSNTPLYVVPNDLDNVVVYPNPYRSDIKLEREVSFDRVPAQATIRLYDISGQLVKTIQKDSNVPFVRWNLENESGSQVASGIYIYIITANGQKRKGKIAIVQ